MEGIAWRSTTEVQHFSRALFPDNSQVLQTGFLCRSLSVFSKEVLGEALQFEMPRLISRLKRL